MNEAIPTLSKLANTDLAMLDRSGMTDAGLAEQFTALRHGIFIRQNSRIPITNI